LVIGNVVIRRGNVVVWRRWWWNVVAWWRWRGWVVSKWFYDTSTDDATGAARYGSFVGEGFGLLVASCG
jgi:hypothetical protein